MRVAYVLKKFPRLSETFILNEILELQRQGVDVEVHSLHRPDDGRFHPQLAELARPVVYHPKPAASDLVGLIREHASTPDARGKLFAEFEVLLKCDRPDVMQVLGWGMLISARLEKTSTTHIHAHFATVAAWVAHAVSAFSGIPYSFTCHAKDIYRDAVSTESFGHLLQSANFAITVCDANVEFVRQHLRPHDIHKLERLYNGIDLTAFHPSRREPATDPFVLAVGRLVEKKGFHHLIDAIAMLQRHGRMMRCVVIGDGDERAALEHRIEQSGAMGIELVGAKTQEEVRHYLQRATMLVLPCVVGTDGNRDALPTVLLEALGAGTPVISTDVAGVDEILASGASGILIRDTDGDSLPGKLADAMQLVLDAPERASEFARTGRLHAEANFDIRRNVAKLRERMATSRTLEVAPS